MNAMEPGLDFWLRYVEAEGGLVEPHGDTALAVLPDHLRAGFDLAEGVTVTADAEAAREDDALLLTAGHPVLDAAADGMLARGDVGRRHLPWPSSATPSRETVLSRLRDQLCVDHGKIDLPGQPGRVYLPVLRVGALVSYTLSFDDRFQELEEVWVDGRTGLAMPDHAVRGLAHARGDAPSDLGELPTNLVTATAGAHQTIAEIASARQEELAQTVATRRSAEVVRTEAYYDAALETIRKRRMKADPERQAAYDAQAEATRVERVRRIAEVEERFRPSAKVRPFRLHLLLLPALTVPVIVRRGPRTYPLTVCWLLDARCLAPVPCPRCRAPTPLVAGRHALHCRGCPDRRS